MPGSSRPGTTTAIPRPLVDAAVRGFAAGYDATSVRQIAADAGLDPVVVGRSFKTKGQLFTEVAAAVIGPVEALAAVAEGPPDRAGERLHRYFRALLADEHQPGMFLGLLRSAVASDEAARLLRQFLAERIRAEITATLRADEPELRTALAASQLVGIAITRDAIGLAPLAAADPGQLVTWVVPVLRHYLAGSDTDQADTPPTCHEHFQLLLAEVIDEGRPSLGTVARRMMVSPRTLQRQLAAHGTTWRAELDALRQRRARQAAHSGTAGAVSLARRLGYADPRSARRAMRRWDVRPGEPAQQTCPLWRVASSCWRVLPSRTGGRRCETHPMERSDRGQLECLALIGASAEDALADVRMRVAAESGLAVPGRWLFSAACRDADPDLFFPVGSSGPGGQQIAEAKAVCARCLVTTDCLSYALATGQDAGVWGGTTEQERRALRSRGSAARAPAHFG